MNSIDELNSPAEVQSNIDVHANGSQTDRASFDVTRVTSPPFRQIDRKYREDFLYNNPKKILKGKMGYAQSNASTVRLQH
jgi:hypothetical protein